MVDKVTVTAPGTAVNLHTQVIDGGAHPCGAGGAPACAKWADFDKTDFAVTTFVPQEHTTSLPQEKFRFDSITNRDLSDDMEIAVDQDIQSANPAAAATYETQLTDFFGNIIAHETGHDLGAIHLRSAAASYIAGGTMGTGGSTFSPSTFSNNLAPLVKFALGLPVTLAESQTVWNYYKSMIVREIYRFNNNLLPSDGNVLLGLDAPFLVVFDGAVAVGNPLPSLVLQTDLGPTLVDGAGGRLCDSLRTIIGSSDLRNRLVASAYQRVRERFSFATMINQTEALLHNAAVGTHGVCRDTRTQETR